MQTRIRQAVRAFVTANKRAGPDSPAQSMGSNNGLNRVHGVIKQVDPLGREIEVLIDDTPMSFYVPLTSTVLISGEPVKLRLLQPLDRVGLVYSLEDGVAVAHSVVVLNLDPVEPSEVNLQPRK